jgi:hypothetical protein
MRIVGTITRVANGTVAPGKANAGQPWQSITVEGMQFFLPPALQNGWQQGQRVKAEVAHQGSRRLTDGQGKTVGYEQDYQLLTIEPVVLVE